MSEQLRRRPAASAAMMAVWSDAAVLHHALAFEAALAEAQAAEGVIDAAAAARVAAVARGLRIPVDAFAEEVALAGTLAIPLVRRLRVAAGDDAAAVHVGATSQDVADSVLVLQSVKAVALLRADARRILDALAPLARRYAANPAIGRTLLQDALPIGFGLRFAHWHAGIADALRGMDQAAAGLTLQFGGAVGTRLGQDGRGAAVAHRLALGLSLRAGPPWHGRRVATAALAAAIGILVGAVAKMARDLALLSQSAIGEVREPAIAGRGGSSAMAHKRNPTGCQVALAAATRTPGLVAGLLTALPGEEERGLGGWQAEAPMLADLALIASGALDAMATVAEGLEIDDAAIARNLAVAGMGADVGESAALVAHLLGDE